MSTTWIGSIILIAVIIVAVMSLGTGCANPAVIQEKISQGALVIDVRTPEEYSSGHYNGATNIPLAELKNHLPDISDKQKPIVVYCASGFRSAKAKQILAAAGFLNVTDAGSLKNLKH